jgi:uncharacterized protein YjdB
MAFAVPLNQNLQLNMSAGLATDYTYVSSAPEKASVNANGVVHGLIPGIVAITVRTVTGNTFVENVLVKVVDPLEATGSNIPYATPVIVP